MCSNNNNISLTISTNSKNLHWCWHFPQNSYQLADDKGHNFHSNKVVNYTKQKLSNLFKSLLVCIQKVKCNWTINKDGIISANIWHLYSKDLVETRYWTLYVNQSERSKLVLKLKTISSEIIWNIVFQEETELRAN